MAMKEKGERSDDDDDDDDDDENSRYMSASVMSVFPSHDVYHNRFHLIKMQWARIS